MAAGAVRLFFKAIWLQVDLTLFSGSSALRALLKGLMPLFLFVNGMEDSMRFDFPLEKEDSRFSEYRRAVLGRADELGRLADRVLREYTSP